MDDYDYWATSGCPMVDGPENTNSAGVFCRKCLAGVTENCLVVLTILKNMIKSVGKDYPIYEMENKKCLKPPTRLSTYNPIDNVGT